MYVPNFTTSSSLRYAFSISRSDPFIGGPAIASGGDGGLREGSVERVIASERRSLRDTERIVPLCGVYQAVAVSSIWLILRHRLKVDEGRHNRVAYDAMWNVI